MYSPKISEELIKIIYNRAKEEKRPMTKVVNDILKKHLLKPINKNKENQNAV